jgi:hypothetical protein
MRRTLFALTLAVLPLAACAESPTGSPYDDEYAVSSADPLFDGAPANGSLPDENKADAIYPAQFDLTADQSPVKSQGRRGVCSIFATTALMENLYIKAGGATPTSPSSTCSGRSRSRSASSATPRARTPRRTSRAASDYGIVEEAAWPYQSVAVDRRQRSGCTGGENLPVQCYTNGAPPQDAVEATKHKLPRGRYLNTNSIKAHLTSKRLAWWSG